jgi:hypothetical protein
VGRIFRAFLWMRWRILVNSLERTGARDRLERFSIAIEKLGPIIALVLLIPSSIALFVLGMTAGFGLGTGAWPLAIEGVRYFLLLATGLTLAGPLILPSRDAGAVIRLLLLPIPRIGLYIGQMVGTLADPWIVLVIPVVLGIPIGFAVALKLVAAVVALIAGLAFLLFLTGLSSLLSAVVHLLFRDRRRGDLVMFLLVFLIPIASMAPQFLVKPERRDGRRLTREERAALPPTRAARVMTRVAPFVPSELYRQTATGAVAAPVGSAMPLAGLALVALAVQAAAFGLYRRVLDMPVSLGARRGGNFGGLWALKIPGLSPGASAVAFTQLRLILRTPKGRASIASPLLMPILLTFIMRQSGRNPLPGTESYRGLGLAAIGTAVAIIAIMQLAVNQFAIDKAGFTRQMLSPLSVRDLLWGKAAGNAMIVALPAVACTAVAAFMFPGGPLGYWLAVLFAAVAAFVLIAPAAAALSAAFPKEADLNSIGNRANPHQAAGLLAMLAFVISIAPSALLAVFASKILHRPEFVPVFTGAWCAVAILLSYALFIPVTRFVDSRRESIAQHY